MKRKQQAFTLVELLTVIAIIGVLASLLLAALSSAKKASQRARCISNLHQISLALNMYLDDCEKRSPDLTYLNSARYLPNPQVLLCPADTTPGWGNLANLTTGPWIFNATTTPVKILSTNAPPLSYLSPLAWEDWAWERLAKLGSRAGLAACQLHGLGKADLAHPSYTNFQGVLLRAQRDGAVVQREVYWDTASVSIMGGYDPASTDSNLQPNSAGSSSYPWRLFSDSTDP
jgi:prepilin-type N-terminal cleavage/methylation domain-containing protein